MKNNIVRIYYIDLLRIIAGFAVIVIHISDPFLNLVSIFGGKTWWIANILNSFSRISVPLFIVLSGSILVGRKNQYDFKTFIKRRLHKILIPLFFWFIFYTFWNSMWFKTPIDINKLFISVFNVKILHLYFLVIMAGLYIITPILSNYSKKSTLSSKKYFLIATYLYCIIWAFLNRFFPDIVPGANIFTVFTGYICFFYSGYFLKSIKISKFKLFLLVMLFIIAGFINAILNYKTATIDNSHILVLNAKSVNQYFFEPSSPFIIFMTISIFVIFSNLNFKFLLMSTRLKNVVVNISSSIFGIYLVHPLIIQLLEYFFHWEIYNLLSPLWLYMLFKIFLVFIFSLILVTLGKKLPMLKVIFGF